MLKMISIALSIMILSTVFISNSQPFVVPKIITRIKTDVEKQYEEELERCLYSGSIPDDFQKVKNVIEIKFCGYNILSLFLVIPGFLIFLTGVFYIITGPEIIYYSSVKGMTFNQFLQVYPGPIASVGSFLIFLGCAINSKKDDQNS